LNLFQGRRGMALSKKATIQIGLGVLAALAILAAVFVYKSITDTPTTARRADVSAADPSGARSQNKFAAGTPSSVAPLTSTLGSPTPTPTATAISVPIRVFANSIRAAGNLVSANQATLAFQAGGRVKEIKVKEGDRVKAGTLLASLDTSSLDALIVQAQAGLDSANAALAKVKAGPTVDDVVVARTAMDRAKAALDQAQAAYDRIGGASLPNIGLRTESLNLAQATSNYQSAVATYNLAVKHPTDAELKAAESTAAQAQASLETAKLNASNARLIAPFDGTVASITPKLGESVTTGTAAMTIADLTRMQVLANVDEVAVASIQVGQKTTIVVDALPDKPLTGRVAKVGFVATTTGNLVTMPVTVDIDATNAAIYPGMSATVEFQVKQ
jgi:HlyD family secretion protein